MRLSHAARPYGQRRGRMVNGSLEQIIFASVLRQMSCSGGAWRVFRSGGGASGQHPSSRSEWLATTTPSRAVEFWNGSASTDWFNAGNWAAIVPNNTTSTRIDTVTPNATVIGAAGAQATGLRVGVAATGALTIQNGGTVNNTLGIIGDNAGSTGTATVDGAGSRWTNSSDFYVGHSGTGTLTIRNGGAVSNVVGFVGRYSTSTSTATVDGAGSTWTNSSDLLVGYAGNGTLTIRNGGAVSNDSALSAAIPARRHRDGGRRWLDLDHIAELYLGSCRQRHADHPQRRHGEQRRRASRPRCRRDRHRDGGWRRLDLDQ